MDGLEACRAGEGFDVRNMDQSFLDFADETFDLVWCRHCLEHSPMPFFTLTQLVRVLKKDALIYIEVPARPDTIALRRAIRTITSVMGLSMWTQLIERAAITIKHAMQLEVGVVERGGGYVLGDSGAQGGWTVPPARGTDGSRR